MPPDPSDPLIREYINSLFLRTLKDPVYPGPQPATLSSSRSLKELDQLLTTRNNEAHELHASSPAPRPSEVNQSSEPRTRD
jgi:hypothetical protein